MEKATWCGTDEVCELLLVSFLEASNVREAGIIFS